MRRTLKFHGEDWSIELDESFRFQMLDFSIFCWRGNQAIFVSLNEERDVAQKVAKLRANIPAEVEETFDFQQSNLTKIGYLQLVKSGKYDFWRMTTYAFSISNFALIHYEFDDRKSLRWALDCWKSVECVKIAK